MKCSRCNQQAKLGSNLCGTHQRIADEDAERQLKIRELEETIGRINDTATRDAMTQMLELFLQD